LVLEPYIQCLVIGVGICVGTSGILWQNDSKPILRWGKKICWSSLHISG